MFLIHPEHLLRKLDNMENIILGIVTVAPFLAIIGITVALRVSVTKHESEKAYTFVEGNARSAALKARVLSHG